VAEKLVYRRTIAIAISAFAIALASCRTPTSTGTLIGHFRIITGGVEYQTVPGSGHVNVFQGPRRLASQVVGSGAAFFFTLPAGAYLVTSTCVEEIPSHETVRSAPQKVSVMANRTTRLEVECFVNPGIG
jgi:hypothetical protein